MNSATVSERGVNSERNGYRDDPLELADIYIALATRGLVDFAQAPRGEG
ncbi:hypothetical protein SAMN05444365_1202 [Micromonospora pattaloongensis]|uniref:Uncharacterized protein n=1 Tax=Micromonospora pattaloongensis TaxID=405436 RepID=A0A1H3T9I0_9ACTN|nr:hypothetical protein SAMN05444365_1202 [Micromonospora pattaloongensis]